MRKIDFLAFKMKKGEIFKNQFRNLNFYEKITFAVSILNLLGQLCPVTPKSALDMCHKSI